MSSIFAAILLALSMLTPAELRHVESANITIEIGALSGECAGYVPWRDVIVLDIDYCPNLITDNDYLQRVLLHESTHARNCHLGRIVGTKGEETMGIWWELHWFIARAYENPDYWRWAKNIYLWKWGQHGWQKGYDCSLMAWQR